MISETWIFEKTSLVSSEGSINNYSLIVLQIGPSRNPHNPPDYQDQDSAIENEEAPEIDQPEPQHEDITPNEPEEARNITLKFGETLRVFHPHSKRLQSIISTSSINAHTQKTPVRTQEHNKPYLPFRTRSEFEQAEIFGSFNVTNSHIDRQLQLLHRMGCGDEIPMANSREYHRLLEDGVFFEELGEV